MKINFLLLILITLTLNSKFSEAINITSEEYDLLNRIFITHINYFLSDDAVTSYGLPLTAYKVGDRARFGYSNPTEWGYLLQAYIAGAERNIIAQSEAIKKINRSLNTMLALQEDPNQNHQKLFYPYYKVTNPAGNDIFPYHDYNVLIPSIDNGLLYMSLLIAEGWARKIGNAEIENKSKTIKDKMKFSVFLFKQGSNKYLAHLINANTGGLSSSKWDIYADEGGLMCLIAYFSNSINFSEYRELTNSQLRSSATWNSYTVKEAAWFNAMFAWGIRSLAGFKVINTNYSKYSFVPTTKAHIAYGDFINVDYPGFSDAMSQVGCVGRYTPPNLANEVPPTPPSHITPHAFFVPFNILPDLDEGIIKNLTYHISLLQNDAANYYHNSGLYPYGFEVIASPYINDSGYSGSSDGRNIFETLSEAYTALSLFNALQYVNNSKDFYNFAINVSGYQTKVNNALNFLYNCSCTAWVNYDCGAFGCDLYQMYQTRNCIPSGCDVEQGCIYDVICESPNVITVCKSGSCDYTTIQEAVNAAQPREIVYVTDKGIYKEDIRFGGFNGKDKVTLDCNGATLLGNGSNYTGNIGIFISKGNDCIIKNCIIKNYYYGFYNWGGIGHLLLNNTAINNTYGFYFDNADWQKLIGNNASHNDYGIYFYWDSIENIIEDNILENNKEAGVVVSWDPHDTIIKNNIAIGNYRGFWSACPYGDHPAYKNNYSGNIAINNTYGFITEFSSNNLFEKNKAIQNSYGFYISGGQNNTLYHNNLINNSIQAFDTGSNFWNYSMEGNYWSNYDEPSEGCFDLNSDGICDNPYVIDTNSQDNYPFTRKNGWLEIFKIKFIQGWNLISIPLELESSSVSYLFNNTNTTIYSYKNNSWFIPNEIDNKLGYWVKINETRNITLSGTEIENKTIKLDEGWNLIGYPYLNEINTNKSDLKNYPIFAYINNSWSSYIPNRTFNSLQKLKPGYGYWVKNS